MAVRLIPTRAACSAPRSDRARREVATPLRQAFCVFRDALAELSRTHRRELRPFEAPHRHQHVRVRFEPRRPVSKARSN